MCLQIENVPKGGGDKPKEKVTIVKSGQSLCCQLATHGPVLIRIRYVAGELEMVPELDSDGNEIPLRHEL